MKFRLPLSCAQRLAVGSARALLPLGAREVVHHAANCALWKQNPPFKEMPEIESGARVLILSPHPDDETLGCAGLILRAREKGARVFLAFLTCGDGSRTTQLALRARRPWHTQSLFEIARTRQGEARDAARILGVAAKDVFFLGFPDGICWKLWNYPEQSWPSPTTGHNRVPYQEAFRVGAPYSRAGLLQVLDDLLCQTAPHWVFTTHRDDTHLDHKSAFHFLQTALQIQSSSAQFWSFLVHYGIWPVPNGLHPMARITPPAQLIHTCHWHERRLDNAQIKAKMTALNCHRTQMASTPRYLSAFVRVNELFCQVA